MYDILIKNGIVIDGTNKKSFKADIAIKKDKIKKIGYLGKEKSKIAIDAHNQYIAPGFIDIHNHSDSYWTLFSIPSLESMLRQGVTTIIGGNCGSSLAPCLSMLSKLGIEKSVQ